VRTLNLGIVAHVDAGKTSLTEQLLFGAGVIHEIGSVDAGSTQTDTLALERQRGITIKSAVVSFAIGGTAVNLIDTPGHPDFIAEVERVLGVLDGAVLVISAVESVQAQTRVLMRTLRRLGIPTLIFVNKIDRIGAGYDRVLRDIRGKLTPAIVAMGTVRELGSRQAAWLPADMACPGGSDPGGSDPGGSDPGGRDARGNDAGFSTALAELLAERDDALLGDYIDDPSRLSGRRLRASLTAQVHQAAVHPVFFGSAMTGAGVDSLANGIAELLPAADGDLAGPVSGSVFKVERSPGGEKIAYVRIYSGRLRARDRIRVGPGPGSDRKVTAISAFGSDPGAPQPEAATGQIAKVWGLGDVQIGDALGNPVARGRQRHFPPPTLETVILPERAADRPALHLALSQLAEQDPLINLRRDDMRQELLISLYGEVQKEVIQATLATEYGISVTFEESTTICVERLTGSGAAAEFMGQEANPFRATIGLRMDPAPVNAGVSFGLEIEHGALPSSFLTAIEETVTDTLRAGLYGWRVTDCTVTLTHSGYTPPPPSGWSKWSSSGGDFRNLTPLVLMTALQRAGTTVCEPLHSFRLELPAGTLPATLAVLARLGAATWAPELAGPACVLEGEIAAARVHDLQQQLPGLTRGEGVLESEFARYQPVRGAIWARPRSDVSPLDRKEYMLHVQRRVAGR
jgi:ribosomal protection tetracycline resistance protein